jgi:hypothetical protein
MRRVVRSSGGAPHSLCAVGRWTAVLAALHL